MNYPDWEDDRMSLRHRSSSITGPSDWSAHPGYPRPGHQQQPAQHLSGYPPPFRRVAGPSTMNSSSAWDLSSGPTQAFPPMMAPTRGNPMHQAILNLSNVLQSNSDRHRHILQAQSMAQLNWRPGMWPPGGLEFGWGDFQNPMLSHVGVVNAPMKRTPSNLSMSAVPDGAHGMWPQQHMMHPMMYPHFHPSMMYLTGSQSHLMGGPGGPMMMMNPGQQQYDPRPPSPASSQRSRRSQKSQRSSQRSSQSSSQKQNRHGGGSSSKPGRWSESEDLSGDSDDSLRDRPTSPRKSSVSGRSGKSGNKDYGPVNLSSGVRPRSPKISALVSNTVERDWECTHCTYHNKAETRICAVCCRTSDHHEQYEQQAVEEEDLPVVMSNLTFNIKEDRTRESVPVQLKSEQLATKDKSPSRTNDSRRGSMKYDNVNKNYEDVNDMLKRLQVRKDDPKPNFSQQLPQQVPQQSLQQFPQQPHNSLMDEIDAVEDDDEEEEERYIEMEEKEPLYERVQFPPTSPVAAVSANYAEEAQGNFSVNGYLQAAEQATKARFRN